MPGTAGTFDSMQDRNQEYTMMGMSGTLGPTYGTAEPRPLTVTEDGKLNTQTTVSLTSGTLSSIGTVSKLESGSVNVIAGTIGTVSNVGQVHNAGTLAGGTLGELTSLANLAKGTITRLEGGTLGILSQGSINVTAGTITAGSIIVTAATITTGTIVNSGTTTGVGTVSGVAVVTSLSGGTITRLEGGTLGILSQGSINITAGTVGGKAASGAAAVANPVLTAGTDAGGTVYAPLMTTTGHQLIDILTGTIQSSGTTTGVGVVTSVTNLAAGTITKLEQGSINVTAGTITAGSIVVTVGTIAAGTVAVSAGTITAGTINAGTVRVNSIPTVHTLTFGTTTTGTIGTLVAAPSAGSAILIDSLDVAVNSGTAEVLVSYGLVSTGNGVVTRGNFVAGGGISKNPTNSIGGSTTGSALTYNILSGSGTVSYSLAYKIAVP